MTNRSRFVAAVIVIALLCAITFVGGRESIKQDSRSFSSSEELAFLTQTASFTLEAYEQSERGNADQARRKLIFQLADTFKFLRESGSLPRTANALCPRLSRIQSLAERLASDPKELRDEPEHSQKYVLNEFKEIVAAAQPICTEASKK